jgi:uncharacterized membrane protein YgcG
MKSTTYILGLAVLALASCSSSKDVVYNGDGVYYNPKKHLEADKALVVHPATKLQTTTSSESSQTNVTNNYYGGGSYYGNDLYYSSRIRRYYGDNYYPYYSSGCGTINYGWGAPSWGYSNYNGCNSCGTFYQTYSYGNCGGGFYNPGYSYYNGYNNYYGSYYGNYGWGGGYSGWKKNNFQNYKNIYSNNNNNTGGTSSTKRYAPRITKTNTNIPGNGSGNPGRAVITPAPAVVNGRATVNDQPVPQKRAANPTNDYRGTGVTTGSTSTPPPSSGNDYETAPKYRPAQIMNSVEEKRNPVITNRPSGGSNTTVINGTTERTSEPVNNNSNNTNTWSTPRYRGNTESVPANTNTNTNTNTNSNNNNYEVPSTPSRNNSNIQYDNRPSYTPPAQQNNNSGSTPNRVNGGGSSGSSSGSSGGSSGSPGRRGPR